MKRFNKTEVPPVTFKFIPVCLSKKSMKAALRSTIAAAYLISIPGPAAWNASAAIFTRVSRPGSGIMHVGGSIQPLSGAGQALAGNHGASGHVDVQSALSNGSALPGSSASAARVPEAVSELTASLAEVGEIAAERIGNDAAGIVSRGDGDDGAPPTLGISVDEGDAGKGSSKQISVESGVEGGRKTFDGEDSVRVYIKSPGENVVSAGLDELAQVVAGDGALQKLLQTQRPRVRLVVAADGQDNIIRDHAALAESGLLEAGLVTLPSEPSVWSLKVRSLLSRIGIHKKRDDNFFSGVHAQLIRLRMMEAGIVPALPEAGTAQSRTRRILNAIGFPDVEVIKAYSAAKKSKRRADPENLSPLTWSLQGVMTAVVRGVLRIPIEIAFLARVFVGSFVMPTWVEVVSGFASNGLKFVSISIPVYMTTYLPKGQYGAFAAVVALELWLNLYHNILFTNWWNTFVNKMVQMRGMTYLYFFSIGYGILIVGLFRLISYTLADVGSSPFSLVFLAEAASIIAPGAFAGALGQQSGSEFYNKGTFTAPQRTLFQHARKWLTDASGALLNTGALGPFIFILAAFKILADVIAYSIASLIKGRFVVVAASERIAATDQFRQEFLARSPKPIQALLRVPFVPGLVRFGKSVATRFDRDARSGSVGEQAALARQAADAYRVAKHDAIALEGAGVRGQALNVEPVYETSGTGERKLKIIGQESWEPPVVVTYPDGAEGVFKRIIKVGKLDQLYRYKQWSRLADVVGSAIMSNVGDRMGGVPTVRYDLATATIDGQKALGVVSRRLDFVTLSHRPEFVSQIANVDQFLRGCVIDMWMGNPDRIDNDHNMWLLASAEPGGGHSAIFGDFNSSLRLGIDAFGIPKIPRRYFATYARRRPEVVRQAIGVIAAMSDEQVLSIVDNALSQTPAGFGASSRDYLFKVLTFNRDELRQPGVFETLTSEAPPRLRFTPEMTAVMVQALTRRRYPRPWGPRIFLGRKSPEKWIDSEVERGLRDYDFIQKYRPELLDPTKRIFAELVRRHVARSQETYEVQLDNNDLFNVMGIFTYLRVDPEAAIAARIGFYR